MKIIGKTDGYDTFIATVNKLELEKHANLYHGKMGELKIGQEIDLGAGYNFHTNIVSACERMKAAMESFDSSRRTMLAFATLVGAKTEMPGWRLAMRVLQSDLYAQLDDAEKAECDALTASNPHASSTVRHG